MNAAISILSAAGLVALAVVYLRAWRRARANEGTAAVGIWRLAAFAGAVVLLAWALVSPLPALGERLLTAHVVQHLTILDFAPILLALSTTPALLRPVERPLRRLLASRFGSPPALLVVYVGSLVFWQLPPLYDLALENPGLHLIQHVQLLAAGTLFWWRELAPADYRDTGGIGVLFYMGAAKLLTGAVASVLIFAPVLYDFYASQAPTAGLSAAEDQELGGLVMMAVDTLLFTVAVMALFVRLLGESDADDDDAEAEGRETPPTKTYSL